MTHTVTGKNGWTAQITTNRSKTLRTVNFSFLFACTRGHPTLRIPLPDTTDSATAINVIRPLYGTLDENPKVALNRITDDFYLIGSLNYDSRAFMNSRREIEVNDFIREINGIISADYWDVMLYNDLGIPQPYWAHIQILGLDAAKLYANGALELEAKRSSGYERVSSYWSP